MNQFQTWYYRQPQALRTIITINVVVYVVAQFLHLWPTGFRFVMEHLALHPVFPGILFEPWQLVTYNFMHTSGGLGGLLHVGFNMLWLYWIGKEFERMHGAQQFWTVYLTTGIGGGIMCLLLQPLFPTITGTGVVPVVGASASVLGMLMTVAILYPYKQIGLLFFGVVRLLYVVVGFLIIDALLMLSTSGTAVAAHWGGALTGFLYAKVVRDEIGVPSWLAPLFGQKPSRSRRPSSSPGLFDRLKGLFNVQSDGADQTSSPQRPASSSDGAPPRRSNNHSKEVDRILDKISEQGYDALSDDEKQILYDASDS
ncbi:MAG: rhomboid family intramembrane serine protease [Salinibacter sp.]